MGKLIFFKENKRINIVMNQWEKNKQTNKQKNKERELKFMKFTKAFKGSSKAEIIEVRSLIVFYGVTFSNK